MATDTHQFFKTALPSGYRYLLSKIKLPLQCLSAWLNKFGGKEFLPKSFMIGLQSFCQTCSRIRQLFLHQEITHKQIEQACFHQQGNTILMYSCNCHIPNGIDFYAPVMKHPNIESEYSKRLFKELKQVHELAKEEH